MTWGELRALDEWRGRLGVEGRVEIGPRRWLELGIAAVNGVVGGAMVVGAVLAGPGAVGLGVGVLGLVVVLASVAGLGRGLRRGPVLVVDEAGLHVPGLQLDAPWSSVLVVGAMRAPTFSWLAIYLERGVIDRWRRTTRVGWYSRRRVHDDRVEVYGLLDADKGHLAAWLQEEAGRRRLRR